MLRSAILVLLLLACALGAKQLQAQVRRCTTTDGTRLLGFHAALLQPAIETGRPILPLAISYLNANGSISLAPSFAGETRLMQCVFAILASPQLTVRLTPLPIIESTDKSRRELSQAAHTAIAVCLSRHGQRPD